MTTKTAHPTAAAWRYLADTAPIDLDDLAVDDDMVVTRLVAAVYFGSNPDIAVALADAIRDLAAELAELVTVGDVDALSRLLRMDGSRWRDSWRPNLHDHLRSAVGQGVHRLLGGSARTREAPMAITEAARRQAIANAIGTRPYVEDDTDRVGTAVRDALVSIVGDTIAEVGQVTDVGYDLDPGHRGPAIPTIELTIGDTDEVAYRLTVTRVIR